jgi:hypothetical protein
VTARGSLPELPAAPGVDDLDALAELPALAVPAPPPLPSELEADLAQLAPVAPRRPWRQLAILVAICASYNAAILAMMALRPDLRELPMAWLIGMGVAWVIGFTVPMQLALVPRPGSALPRWRQAGIAAVLAAIGFVVIGLTIHPSGPHSATHVALARGYGCLRIGVATSLLPVLVGTLFLRRALPIGSRWIAAALGAGGGSLAGLMLHLHCHMTDAVHVGIMHGGVVGIAALLAAAVVPRATDLR